MRDCCQEYSKELCNHGYSSVVKTVHIRLLGLAFAMQIDVTPVEIGGGDSARGMNESPRLCVRR